MVKSVDEIYQELRYKNMQDNGNVVDIINTYSVKSKQVNLLIEKTPSGNNTRYKIVMTDSDLGDQSEAEVLFTQYPSKCIDHSIIIGSNNNRVYWYNSGIKKNFRDILKAIARLYNVSVCVQHY